MSHLSRFVPLAGIFVLALLRAEEAPPQFGHVRIVRDTEVRQRPDPASPVIGHVAQGVTAPWVAGQTKNSFVRIVVPRGPEGWVVQRDVAALQKPRGAPEPEEATAGPCFPTLAACPEAGCAAKTDAAEVLFNTLKRRVPAPDAAVLPIDFDDLRDLQRQADSLVGSGSPLSAVDRARLHDLKVKHGTVAEGSVVRLSGFVAAKGKPPHPNTGESVNCRLKATANNDFHINVTAQPNQTEFDGVVVEMIPQHRNSGWTLPRLAQVQKKQLPVLVTGALFYDNEHVVNDDPANPVGSSPKRLALWEVHPITSFLVCVAGNGKCDPDSTQGWVPVEKLP